MTDQTHTLDAIDINSPRPDWVWGCRQCDASTAGWKDNNVDTGEWWVATQRLRPHDPGCTEDWDQLPPEAERWMSDARAADRRAEIKESR